MKDNKVRDALNGLFAKVIDAPEIVESLRKYLVNRDLAIEIDGQRFQITKRKPTDEEKELVVLREQRINLKRALKEVINAVECQRGDPDEWCTKATTEARKVMTEN
jgi:hypothetical protein